MKYVKKLGIGAMGTVYLAKNSNTNEYFAAKVMDRKVVDRPQVKNTFNVEIKMLQQLKHPSIIKLIDYGKTHTDYILTLEYCNGGSLLSCFKKYKNKNKKPFSEEIVQHIMRQVVEGVKFIHQNGIIHRDLKLDNILVKFKNNEDLKNLDMLKATVKISDFGISIKADKAFTVAGSPIYSDPLILKRMNERNDLKDSDGYDKSADIWSLGALCYEMLIGHWIFNGRNIGDLIQKVEIGKYSIPTTLSKEVSSFLNGMLQYDPARRLTIEELANHDFLRKNVKDFTQINLELFGSKVKNDKLYINIKKNQTVWDILNDDTKLSAINTMLNLVPYEMYESSIKIPSFGIKPNNMNNNNFNKFNNNNVNNNANNINNLNKDKKNVPNNKIILNTKKTMPENNPKVNNDNIKKSNSENIHNNFFNNFQNTNQNPNLNYNKNPNENTYQNYNKINSLNYNQNTFQHTNNQNNHMFNNFNNTNPPFINRVPQNNVNPNFNVLNNRAFIMASAPISNNNMMQIQQNISNTANHY